MDIAPPEIWTTISAYACTDAGSTGRSLSLVSKFIRDVSAPFKLQSMSIHGRQQAVAFQDLLLRTPPHLRRVRYLYLSSTLHCPSPMGVADSDSEEASDSFEAVMALRQPRKRKTWYAILKERQKEVQQQQQIVIALNRVLQTTAEWVEVLYLDDHDPFHVSDSPLIIFPRLEELASSSFPIHDSPDDGNGPRALAVCPKLRRWHLMSLPIMQFRGREGDILSTIAAIAPSITHLFFSDFQQEILFPSDLKFALDVIEPQQSSFRTVLTYTSGLNQPTSYIGRLPKSIENVYVKPAPPPSPGRCGYSYMCYESLKGDLEALSRTDSRIVLLPSYVDHRARCTVSGWEERIDGGDGCWSLHERITT
ncbi:hypothetical protein HWV62_30729 [Athelia sp. TMB]|nr:hypothetical protein HWV62_30729 [Athelia sp. TMB]